MQINIPDVEDMQRAFDQIKACFIAKGTTYREWCGDNNLSVSNTKQAFFGVWSGPKGKDVRKRLIAAATKNDRTA